MSHPPAPGGGKLFRMLLVTHMEYTERNQAWHYPEKRTLPQAVDNSVWDYIYYFHLFVENLFIFYAQSIDWFWCPVSRVKTLEQPETRFITEQAGTLFKMTYKPLLLSLIKSWLFSWQSMYRVLMCGILYSLPGAFKIFYTYLLEWFFAFANASFIPTLSVS